MNICSATPCTLVAVIITVSAYSITPIDGMSDKRVKSPRMMNTAHTISTTIIATRALSLVRPIAPTAEPANSSRCSICLTPICRNITPANKRKKSLDRLL